MPEEYSAIYIRLHASIGMRLLQYLQQSGSEQHWPVRISMQRDAPRDRLYRRSFIGYELLLLLLSRPKPAIL
jgi:hypothetical protein